MKLSPSDSLVRFFLQVLLWLPVCFALWYYLSAILTAPAMWIANIAVNALHSGLIESIEHAGTKVTFLTGLQVPMPNAPPGAVGQVVVETNPLIYCWNLPVLIALLFATDEQLFSLKRLAIGYLLLLPFQAFGIAFDFLKSVAIGVGPEISSQLDFSATTTELIALGYQFGYLMLPVIAATTIWVAMNRELIESMLKGSAGGRAASAPDADQGP